MKQSSEQEQLIKELEIAIERLQALYNQYFMGIEKLEPTIAKKDVERKMNVLRNVKFNNTALRFRFQSQVQKFSTHQTYWRRICRQIEEGTYERDIRRAKARNDVRDEVEAARKALDKLGEDQTGNGFSVDLGDMMDGIDDPFTGGGDLQKQLKSAAAAAEAAVDRRRHRLDQVGPPPPPPPPPPPGAGVPKSARKPAAPSSRGAVEPDRLKSVYRAYVAARKRTNERVDNLSFRKVARLLRKTEQEKGGVKDFIVVIKNGKAVIKTVKE